MDILARARTVISEEQQAIKENINLLDESYLASIKVLEDRQGKIVFTGVGKSGHIGEKLAATFSSLGSPAIFVHSTEAVHGDLGMVERGDVVILLSNSGTTKEVLNTIPSLRIIGTTLIAFTSNKNSALALESDYVLGYSYGKEADQYNLAPTTSAIAMLSIGDSIGVVLSELKGFKKQDFKVFHPGGALGKKLGEGDKTNVG
ncbi:KpsF/GutQ family sugar-phosphate isomerase [Enterococcus massiliensis]|uniref:KpsF/GutQ family sugar-phosphate isomerase n=1 Tax=Enterococcus massiliensis TaxID=1640685 RepID=UPI00065DBE44|nr:SIS domain-containing protein [Enterococcus massiliensis]